MSKKKVVLASVLKPVNDTRMYGKIGLTLANTQQYNVNIVGFKANNHIAQSNITSYPIFDFGRLSVVRFFSAFKFYKTLKKVKPDLIIINTHELLWPSILYKKIYGSKVVYDVLENHFRNILFTNAFPLFLRPFLALWVRAKEYITAPQIDHFFLAEKYYDREISYIKNRYTILENKFQTYDLAISEISKNKDGIELIFSGTLAESTGVFGAIDLAKKLHNTNKDITLKIIGYSPKKEVIKQIKNDIKNCNFIELIGGDKLVNHDKLVRAIQSANYGIIYYPTNKSTINCTPTKLYEYLSNQLPIIMNIHEEWTKICAPYHAAISIDFNKYDASQLLKQMGSQNFYPNGVGKEFLWKSEEGKLTEIINFLIR